MRTLVKDIEGTAKNMDIDYDQMNHIPKLSRNAVQYIPRQVFSTNEIQRSIIGNDDILSQLISKLNINKDNGGNIIIYNTMDSEVIQKVIKKKEQQYKFATNGGF